MTAQEITTYPLTWPPGWPRCQSPQHSRFDTTLAKARAGLLCELDRLGARDVVISSNAALLKSGEIAGRQPYLEDTGVAVYFALAGQQRVIPCDKWIRLGDNLRAIELTVAALRGLERWGTPGIVAAAFVGFYALPAGPASDGVAWWEVLGLPPNASAAEIERAYRRLVKATHPDVAGGDRSAFERVQAAYVAASRRSAA